MRTERGRELQELAYVVRVAFHAQDAQYEKAMKALDGKPVDPDEEMRETMKGIMSLIGAKR